jgi:hypothetical protein
VAPQRGLDPSPQWPVGRALVVQDRAAVGRCGILDGPLEHGPDALGIKRMGRSSHLPGPILYAPFSALPVEIRKKRHLAGPDRL